MSLSWWRKILGRVSKRKGGRRHVRLCLETFEERLVPSGTYLWTGAGASNNWDDAGNWMPAAGASGSFPGSGGSTSDIAQFVDTVAGGIVSPVVTVDAAFTLAEIDFGSHSAITISGDGNAAHALTVTGKIFASDAISHDGNIDDIAAPLVAGNGVQLTNTAASSAAILEVDQLSLSSNAAITTGRNNVTIGALTATGNNTLTNLGSGILALTGAVNLAAGNVTLAGNIQAGGTISGSGGITVSGPGAVTLGGANSYTGATLVNSGATLDTTSSTALGNGSLNLPAGATLNVSGPALSTAGPTLLQIGSLSGSGTIDLGPITASTSIDNNGISVDAGVGTGQSSTFTGSITSLGVAVPGFANLVKNGTGTFVLPGGESYRGYTIINSGTLEFGTVNTPVTSLPTADIIDNGNLLVIPPFMGTLTYTGSISGAGGVSFQNTGTLISITLDCVINLSGQNTYAGSTFLGGNTLVQAAPGSLPANSIITLGTTADPYQPGIINLNGYSSRLGGLMGMGIGNNAVINSTTAPVSLTFNNPGTDLTIRVPIINQTTATNGDPASPGAISVSYTGVGTDWLEAINTYTGSTTINGPYVNVSAEAGVGITPIPVGTALTVESTGVLDLENQNISVTSLTGIGSSNTITNSSPFPSTLTITGGGAASYTYAGSITGSVTVVGAMGGSTTEVLGGGLNDTFTGGVTADSGTLSGIPGSFGEGPITLNGGTADLEPGQAVDGFGGTGAGWTVNIAPGTTPVAGTGTFTNGGTSLPASNTFEVTSNNPNQASDLIYNTPVQPDSGFTASFLYYDNSPNNSNPGGGIVFMLEADPKGTNVIGGYYNNAFGIGGNGSGAGGAISNAIGFTLELTPLGVVGSYLPLPVIMFGPSTTQPLPLGDPIEVSITYNAPSQIILETLTDTVTGASTFAQFSGVNLLAYLGASNVLLGFGGSTGFVEYAQQFVSNFTYLGASGGATAYANNIQGNGNLELQVTSLANAYSTSGNLSPGSMTISPDAASTPNQPYSLSIAGTTTVGGNVNVNSNGTGAGALILNGPVNGNVTATVPASVTIGAIGGSSGNLTLGAISTYNEVLGSTTQPGGWDDLSVGGALNLTGGNLSVSYANSFAPSLGEQFTVLQSTGPLTGTFAQASSIAAGNVTYSITYNANSVVLTATHVITPTKLTFTGTVPTTATAGSPTSFTVSAVDNSGNVAGGDNDTLTISDSLGAGTVSPTNVQLVNGSAIVPITFTTVGSQTLTLTDVTNPGLTAASTTVTVSPGPFDHYQVTTLGTSGGSQAAGNSFLVSVQAVDADYNAVSSYSGPSQVTATVFDNTTSTTLTLPSSTFSWQPTTNSGSTAVVNLSSTGAGLALATLDIAGSYTLSVSGGAGFATKNAPMLTIVNNIAAKLGFTTQPVITATGDKLANVVVAVVDTFGNVVVGDSSDSVTLSVATGPAGYTSVGSGSGFVNSTLIEPVQSGLATFNNLTLIVPGNYTLGAIVPAKYIGPSSNPFLVSTLQVTLGSFQGSPDGFTVSFNAPFLANSVTPVLYGQGYGPTAPVPSATLTQVQDVNGNPVDNPALGSLILNQATNSITFLATNTVSLANNGTPILPDGVYVADLTSSAATDGWQALNSGGGFLDGLRNGVSGSGDFTATFTVNAAASDDDVLWVPATADGPGQPLSAPGMNQVGGGYPVYFDNVTGWVNYVEATLNYNPALLAVTGVTGTDFSLLSSSTSGHANLLYSGPSLPAGMQVIGYITAVVPCGTASNPTPYKAKDLLHFSSVSAAYYFPEPLTLVLGDPVTSSDALHLVAYVGDADGDGVYTSDDAVKLTQAMLQSNSGFAAYPLVDPVIVGDTDGDGFIPADAPGQINEASVGYPTANLPVPPIPSGVVFQAISNNVDPILSLGVGGQGSGVSSDVVAVAVNIDDADPAGSTGLIRGTLVLNYDPRVFTVSAADVQLASLLAGGGWSLSPTIDPATGQMVISISSDTAISSSVGGSLVTVDFHPLSTAGASSAISLAPPGGPGAGTELEDAQGAFALTLGKGASFITIF